MTTQSKIQTYRPHVRLLDRLATWRKRRALRHQDRARVRQIAHLLDTLNDAGLLNDVTGLCHAEVKAALRLPASQARREIARLMRDASARAGRSHQQRHR